MTAPETGYALVRARELWEQLGSPKEFHHIAYLEEWLSLIMMSFRMSHARHTEGRTVTA
jgi:hypothetical protein